MIKFFVQYGEGIFGEFLMTEGSMSEAQQAKLASMLELAKITEQKARELNELAIAFEAKWKGRSEDRLTAKQKAATKESEIGS